MACKSGQTNLLSLLALVSPASFDPLACILQSVVWSLGVLAYQLLLQRLPFKGSRPDEIRSSMLSRTKGPGVNLPLWFSDDALSFIRSALSPVRDKILQESVASRY
jgi:hypothetical protein